VLFLYVALIVLMEEVKKMETIVQYLILLACILIFVPLPFIWVKVRKMTTKQKYHFLGKFYVYPIVTGTWLLAIIAGLHCHGTIIIEEKIFWILFLEFFILLAMYNFVVHAYRAKMLEEENKKYQKIEQKILQHVRNFATQVIFHDITILKFELKKVIDKKQWDPILDLNEKLGREPSWKNINKFNKELEKIIKELEKNKQDIIADKYTKEMYKSLIYNYHIWLKIFEITYYQFDFCR